MRAYRFFLKNPSVFPLLQKKADFSLLESVEPDIIFQLTKVLRAKAGDLVILLAHQKIPESQANFQEPGQFFEYHYEISELTKKVATLKFLKAVENNKELTFRLELVLCLPNKPDKLEFILQKAVELGVARIILVEGDFSQMKHQLRLERLQKIMTEAAEQSERAYVPALLIQEKLVNLLEDRESDQLLVAMERLEEDAENFFDLSKINQKKFGIQTTKSPRTVSILIGPEGGFSAPEKAIIYAKKFPCFSLGKRILRMETAAILALGIIAQKQRTSALNSTENSENPVIEIKEVALDEAFKVHQAIPEFQDSPKQTKQDFENRYKGKEKIILVASIQKEQVGYIIGYDRDHDGSFYCWMVGVKPEFRGKGVLKALMHYQEEWAKNKGYKKLTIKTRNQRREMLHFLVKHGFYFTKIEQQLNINENKLHLERTLIFL